MGRAGVWVTGLGLGFAFALFLLIILAAHEGHTSFPDFHTL